MDADANAGLDPSDEAWIDTTPGGFYHDIAQAFALEIERLWDFAAVEVPAAAFISYAFGEYLDEHGAVLNVPRKDVSTATGEVTVRGENALLSSGTTFATPQTDPELDPVEFVATSSATLPSKPANLTRVVSTGGTLAAGTYYYKVTSLAGNGETTASAEVSAVVPVTTLSAPTGLTATPSTTGGTLAAGTYYYKVTALNANGETVGSTEVSAVTTGTTSSVALAWTAVTGATSYRVYRGTAANGQNTYFTAASASFTDTGAAGTAGTVPATNTATVSTGSVALDWDDVPGATGYRVYRSATSGAQILLASIATATSTYTDAGAVTPSGSGPPTVSTATVDLAVAAAEPGSQGNAATGTVTVFVTPIAGAQSVINAGPISGGADVESDEAYRERLLLEVGGAQGASTISDYERWALAYPGVGFVKVEPHWRGAGTVRVIITDPNDDPVSAAVISGLNEQLDPAVASGTLNGAHVLGAGPFTITLNGSNAAFHTAGAVYINDQRVTYTGKAGTNQLTGGAGGTGTMATNSPVVQRGEGRGLATVGAEVTVATAATFAVNVVATVSHEEGYSLDGAAGTIATRQAIKDSLTAYVNALRPGDDIVFYDVLAAIMIVDGVYDISGLTVNGGTANVAVGALQVADLGTVTLS